MVDPPANYTWIHEEIPSSVLMQARLSNMANFLLNPPMVRLRKTTAQSIPNNSHTAVSWDLVEVENYNMWDSTAPTKVTPSVPGWYLGSAGISFLANTTGYREMDARVNGIAQIRIKLDPNANGGIMVMRGNTFLSPFNGTTDFCEVTAFQNSGGSLGVSVDIIERQPDLSMRWVATL